jgi:UDP-N-acetylmuramoyl-L-alanyl-D-glutamate--2,6-diaminopimelate ligase
VRTDNSRRALALASRNFFGDPASKMKLVGVTGTNGKTTSTMLLKHLLETKGEKVGLIGTNQNMIGSEVLPTERTTPESFELQKLFYDMANAGCTYCVMEVSSHSLVLDRVAGINFEVGAFTNLTQDHLDFHKTMDEYARCKALLFNQSKTGVINLDDEWAKFMLSSAECPTMTYSERDKSADVCAEDIALTARNVSFTLSGKRVELGIPGRFSVYNALTVITTGLALGFSLDDCIAALKTANGVKGRVEVVPTDGDYTVLIDYAHTPDALENVIKSMKEVTHGRVVAVFGCGGDRDRTKRPIMGNIAVTNADFAVITSDNPRTEQPDAIIADITAGLPQGCDNYVVIADRTEAIHWAIDNHREGDVIILAGKGHETYQIIGKTKHHMDEREIVAEYLETRKQR